jgi:hypothetical protein
VQLAGPRSAASLTFFNEIGQYTIDPAPGQNTLTLADAQGNGAGHELERLRSRRSTPTSRRPTTLTRLAPIVDSRETNFNGFVNAGGIKLTGSGAINFNGATHANVITTRRRRRAQLQRPGRVQQRVDRQGRDRRTSTVRNRTRRAR